MTTFKLLPEHLIPEADVQAFAKATRPGSWFDDPAPAADWSAATKRGHWLSYRRWTGHLYHTEPDALALPPAQRITEARVRTYIAHLQATISACGVWNYAKDLLAMARLFAPDQDWSWLSSVVSNLERLIVPRDKRPRLRSSHDLVALGMKLMDQAESSTALSPIEQAVQFRDGLIIALLADRPVRRRNLAGTLIGHNLIATHHGFDLHYPAHETKTGTEIRFPVPAPLVPRLNRYLTHYRPLFPGADGHNGLWASTLGGILQGDAIYFRIIKRTKAEFGTSVNPHLFRDALATTLAIECPGKIGLASRMLGHSTEAFTQAHYVQAGTITASRSYSDTLRDLRRELTDRSRQRRTTDSPQQRVDSNPQRENRP